MQPSTQVSQPLSALTIQIPKRLDFPLLINTKSFNYSRIHLSQVVRNYIVHDVLISDIRMFRFLFHSEQYQVYLIEMKKKLELIDSAL